MRLRRCPVGHRVPHDADMGGHPLKVDREARRSETEEKVVNGKGEGKVGVGAVEEDELEG